jgi:hypothetical protein
VLGATENKPALVPIETSLLAYFLFDRILHPTKSLRNGTITMKVQWVDERTGGPLATILGNANYTGWMGGLSSYFDIGGPTQPSEGLDDEFSMNSGDFLGDAGAKNMSDTSFGESARDYSSMNHFFNASNGRDCGDFDFDPDTDLAFFDAEDVSLHSIDLSQEVIADRGFGVPGMEPSSGEETDSDIAHDDGEGSVFEDEPPGAVDAQNLSHMPSPGKGQFPLGAMPLSPLPDSPKGGDGETLELDTVDSDGDSKKDEPNSAMSSIVAAVSVQGLGLGAMSGFDRFANSNEQPLNEDDANAGWSLLNSLDPSPTRTATRGFSRGTDSSMAVAQESTKHFGAAYSYVPSGGGSALSSAAATG